MTFRFRPYELSLIGFYLRAGIIYPIHMQRIHTKYMNTNEGHVSFLFHALYAQSPT